MSHSDIEYYDFYFQIYIIHLYHVLGHISAEDLTVSKKKIMEAFTFPYLENIF